MDTVLTDFFTKLTNTNMQFGPGAAIIIKGTVYVFDLHADSQLLS